MLSTDTGKVLLNGAAQAMWTFEGNLVKPSKTVSCLGWHVNFIDPTEVKAKTVQHARVSTVEPSTDDWDEKFIDLTLEDFLDRTPDKQRLAADPQLNGPQLPDPQLLHRLKAIDPDDAFPRLGGPPMPTSHVATVSAADAFSSQVSLDAIFHSNLNQDSNTVATLIVCSTDGRVQPIIHDAMNIGELDLPTRDEALRYQTLLVASQPFSCTHALLVQVSLRTGSGTKDVPSRKLAFVPLTLRGIRSAGTTMKLIASKATTLQNLYYYMDHVGGICRDLYRESRRIPENKLELLREESAKEHGEAPVAPVDLLYQLAATGYVVEGVGNWLTEAVSERVTCKK